MGYLIKPIDMTDEAKEKMRCQAIEAGLKRIQEENINHCPKCGSTNIHIDNNDESFLYCCDCRHTWTP